MRESSRVLLVIGLMVMSSLVVSAATALWPFQADPGSAVTAGALAALAVFLSYEVGLIQRLQKSPLRRLSGLARENRLPEPSGSAQTMNANLPPKL